MNIDYNDVNIKLGKLHSRMRKNHKYKLSDFTPGTSNINFVYHITDDTVTSWGIYALNKIHTVDWVDIMSKANRIWKVLGHEDEDIVC